MDGATVSYIDPNQGGMTSTMNSGMANGMMTSLTELGQARG